MALTAVVFRFSRFFSSRFLFSIAFSCEKKTEEACCFRGFPASAVFMSSFNRASTFKTIKRQSICGVGRCNAIKKQPPIDLSHAHMQGFETLRKPHRPYITAAAAAAAIVSAPTPPNSATQNQRIVIPVISYEKNTSYVFFWCEDLNKFKRGAKLKNNRGGCCVDGGGSTAKGREDGGGTRARWAPTSGKLKQTDVDAST